MNNEKKLILQKQKGFTLFEILIGAVIFTILAAIIVPQLTAVKDRNVLVTQEVSLMATTISNLQDRYSDERIGGLLDNAEMVNGKIIADSYRVDGVRIYNLFGGEITIDGVSANGLDWVTEGITEAACVKLVDDVNKLGYFDEVDVDGGGSLDYGVKAEANNVNYTRICAGAFEETDAVTITFQRFEG